MKTLLLALTCISSLAFGQGYNPYNYSVNRPYLDNENESWLREIAKGKKVRSVVKNGESKNDLNSYVLNEDGFITEAVFSYRSGLFGKWKQERKKYTYGNGMVTQIDFYDKKGQPESKSEFEYFAPGRIKRNTVYKKGVLKFENLAVFNADTTMASYTSNRYSKGEKKLINRYEHEYYADKQRKCTRQYNKHNQLKYTWNYACDQKGELEKKTTQVCKNTGVDQKGRTIEVLFNTDPKGNKTKNVTTSYGSGTNKHVVQYEFYIIKKGVERKLYETHFPDSLEMYYSHKNFDEDGRVVYENRIDYRQFGSGKKIPLTKQTTSYRRGKERSRTLEEFNERGLPLQSVTKVKGKVSASTVYVISDNGYTVKYLNNKSKVTREYNTRIEYF